MDIFIDTSIWISSRFGAGPEHDWAVQCLDRKTGLFVSPYVIDEVVAYCLGSRDLKHKRPSERRAMADAFLKLFQESAAVQVLSVDDAQFGEAKTLFESSGLALSLTDWTDLIVARDNRISDVASFDRAFRDCAQIPGFERLRILPPAP